MKRIIFLSKSPPYPTDSGGRQRSNILWRALSELGRVDLLLIGYNEHPKEEDWPVLRRDFALANHMPIPSRLNRRPWRWMRFIPDACLRVVASQLEPRDITYRRNPRAATMLAQLAQDGPPVDLIVSRYLTPLALTGFLRGVPVILDVDDVDTQHYTSRLESPTTAAWRRPLLRLHRSRIEKAIVPIFNRCDALWVTKETDRSLPGLQRASLLENIPFVGRDKALPQPLAPSPQSQHILFVGSLRYRPNLDGLRFFIKQVWPRVHAAVPTAVLRIVGTGLRERNRRAWSAVAGVQVEGYVADLASAYADCSFCIAPIYFGAGTNIKVLEALLYGRTVVTTPQGLEGHESVLEPGRDLMVGRTPDEMANSCISLLQDPARSAALASSGRSVVLAHHSYSRFAAEVHRTIESVLSSGRST